MSAPNQQYISMRGVENPISHWSPFPVRWRGIEFQTSEHACQAAKYWSVAPDVVEEIRQASTPRLATDIASRHVDLIRRDWRRAGKRVVMEICMEKVKQHSQVRAALWESERYPIVLDTSDEYWGVGRNGRGLNTAGKIMELCRDIMFRNPYPLSQEEMLCAIEQ